MGRGQGNIAQTEIVIDPGAFTRSYYSQITDLAEVSGESETIELVQGHPETLARMWKMPLSTMRMGVIETIYQAMIAHPDDDAAFRDAVIDAQDQWGHILEGLKDEMMSIETLSAGTDGMVIEIDSSLAGMLGLPDA